MDDPLLKEILLTEKRIQKRVLELGGEISRDYAGRELVLIGILKGAVVFLADLVRAISIPHTFDFVGASSYGAGTCASGEVTITKDVSSDLADKHVLLIEDIYDSGNTLESVRGLLELHRPASIEICGFIVKDRPREREIHIKYVGFRLPDIFVVGYGLDYAEKFRNLRFVASLNSDKIPGSPAGGG